MFSIVLQSLSLIAAHGSDAPCTLQRSVLVPDSGVPTAGAYGYPAALGERFAAVSSLSGAGTVHVFSASGDAWQEHSRLVAPDATVGDAFGASLLLGDTRIVVGAVHKLGAGGLRSGSVCIYQLRAGAWVLADQLFPQGATTPEVFGFSLAASEERLLIGAPMAEDLGYQSGAAYVFRRDGERWTQEARLLPDPAATIFGAVYGEFGHAVALSGDTAQIGAPGHSLVYVFRRLGTSWVPEGRIEGQPGTRFGAAIALDERISQIGAPYWPYPEWPKGAVHAFERSGADWEETQTITTDSIAFGFGGTIARDGDLAAVGTLGYIGIIPSNGAWVVERSGDRWGDPVPVLPLVPDPNGMLGKAVSIAGRRLLVGRPSFTLQDGSAYLFDIGQAAGGRSAARHGPGNVEVLRASRASVGRTLSFEVDPVPGYSSARVFGFEQPAAIAFGGGTLLCQDAGSGLLFASWLISPSFGSPARWSLAIPATNELAGLSLCAQAYLISPSLPVALTNAYDIVLGSCGCPQDP